MSGDEEEIVQTIKDANNIGISTKALQTEIITKTVPKNSKTIPKTTKRSKPISPRAFRRPLKRTPKQKAQPTAGNLTAKLNRYYDYWPQLKPKNPNFTNVSDLLNEIERCQQCLNTKSCIENAKNIDSMFNVAIEKFLVASDKPCDGFALYCMNHEEYFEDEIKELSIKYDKWLSTGPEMRYISKKLRVMYMILNQHQMPPNMDDLVEKDDFEPDKYNDY